MVKYSIAAVIITLFFPSPSFLRAEVAISEDFSSLSRWEELYFNNIDTYTHYSLAEIDGTPVLRIESNMSASGIIYTDEFSVYDYPIVEWQWRADQIIEAGNAKVKEGDDYPVRIYIIFPYNPDSVRFFERIAFEALKVVYGEYPPMASLNYIWANREHEEWAIPNPFTSRAMMIPVEEGPAYLGGWRSYRVNLIEDYRLAFGKEPPPSASIAIMGDTDNTGSQATAYIDYIRVRNQDGL